MKREGYLVEKIADPDNLRMAFWKAQKNKGFKAEVEIFRRLLDTNLVTLREELLNGEVRVGNYHYFRIFDPKERSICAAAFRERVLHHAIMNVCHPTFENFQTNDSYATRKGKGQYAALDKACVYTSHYKWFCKLDVRKFFDSIDHEILYTKLCRKFKDPRLLSIFRAIINSYAVSMGKGIPIGNLTSQYFANFYLGYADHYVKEKLHVPAYVRYMDDMVLWHNDKAELLLIFRELEQYITTGLKMKLKPICINATNKGVPFLGYVLFPTQIRLNKNSKKRFKRKIKLYETKLRNGQWTQLDYACHVGPLVAFTRYANTLNMRRFLILSSEAGYNGL